MTLFRHKPSQAQEFATQLQEILMRSPEIGMVGVKAEWSRTDPAVVLVSTADRHYSLEVRDNGPREVRA